MLVVLDGDHASGKSTHANALASYLRDHNVNAIVFKHAPPSRPLDPWALALHYATERATFCEAMRKDCAPPAVVVCDRWVESTEVLGRAIYDHGNGDRDPGIAMIYFATAEGRALPSPRLRFLLTAPSDVLDARVAARGREVLAIDRKARVHYRNLARVGWREIDTTGAREEATEHMAAIVLQELGAST